MKPSTIHRSNFHWYSWNTLRAAPLLPIQSPGQTSSADHSCQNWVFQYISIIIVTASNDIFIVIASINIVIVIVLMLALAITHDAADLGFECLKEMGRVEFPKGGSKQWSWWPWRVSLWMLAKPHIKSFRLCLACLGGKSKLANCPAVFLSYLSLWICYEIQLKNTKITMNNTSRLIRAIF